MMAVKGQETTRTYQEALDQRIVKEGDYFLVQYPDGRNKLFRLVKRNKGYVLWGPPTDGTITLIGKEGYDNLFTLVDALVEKEYPSEGVFEEVHACGLSEKEYEYDSYEEWRKTFKKLNIISKHPDDVNLDYVLASRGFSDDDDSSPCFWIFAVYGGRLHRTILLDSLHGVYSTTYAVRPEATPKSTLLLETKGCDGSKENPWICLGSQERMKEDTSKNSTTGESMESMSKSELMSIIQEGRELIQKESEWLAKLEKYAENLK